MGIRLDTSLSWENLFRVKKNLFRKEKPVDAAPTPDSVHLSPRVSSSLPVLSAASFSFPFSRPGLAVALDLPDLDDAVAMGKRLAPHVDMFKVGLELVTRFGPQAFARVGEETGKPIFADLKLHDIPRTVEAALSNLLFPCVRLVTIHIAGGRDMAEAALLGASIAADRHGGERAGVLGITVLTSLDVPSLREVGIERTPLDVIRDRLHVAREVGLDGAVCSVADLELARSFAGEMLLVTPGIRSAPLATPPQSGSVPSFKNDQRRIGTVKDAIENGSGLLVVGRPVLFAPDPEAAAREIHALLVARSAIAG